MTANCLNCGCCCHTTLDGHLGTVVSCKYLKDLGDGTTACTRYNKRLGTVIAQKDLGKVLKVAKCTMRSESPWSFPGCPQNVSGFPCFVEHCKEVMKK